MKSVIPADHPASRGLVYVLNLEKFAMGLDVATRARITSRAMARLSREAEKSQRAKLWKASGEKEFCTRLAAIVAEAGGAFDRKRLPEALGIGAVSLYSILRGTCTYGLFLNHIGPAEVARMQRRAAGKLSSADKALSEGAWKRLQIAFFIDRYAPQLRGPELDRGAVLEEEEPSAESPAPRQVLNEIFDVGHDLVEDVTPCLVQMCSQVYRLLSELDREFAKRKGPFRKSERATQLTVLRGVIDELSFPAGILANTATAKLLGCNQHLCDVLRVDVAALAGGSFGQLIEVASRNIPAQMRQEFQDSLSRRMGLRVSQSREKSPLCFQFYLNIEGSKNRSDGCYRVTVVAMNAELLGRFSDDLACFFYHLKHVGAPA